ncbi:MAG: type II secretion system GspH family protein [Gemmatimonadales bacterium]|jgi:prepilin-type N-terminal cleavage/methylation domain-containing protein|nr:type II secretion system GspH family protein [Gemmatimonadales bacterium]
MTRRGFSFVEMLVVMIVLGILASIAILRYRDLTNEALAGKVATDMQTIRLAAMNYYADTDTWPADAADGTVPPELVPLLPDNWSFTAPNFTYDFDNLGPVVGVTVRSPRPGLLEKLRQRLVQGAPFVDTGGSVMYLLIGPGVSI